MIKKILPLLSLLFSLQATAADFRMGAGLGYDYGILGMQFAYQTEQTKTYVALSAFHPISAVGFQFTTDKDSKHAYGINTIIIADSDSLRYIDEYASYLSSATYNYHFNGFSNDGWVLGFNIFLRGLDASFISIGYTF